VSSRARSPELSFNFAHRSGNLCDLQLALTRQRSEVNPKLGGTYERPSYFKFFGQYATSSLDDSTLLRLNTSNGRPSKSSTAMPPYHLAQQYRLLDPNLLDSVLTVLRDGSASKSSRRSHSSGPASAGMKMEEIVRYLNPNKAHHPDEIRRHIMWLLKYGIIEVR
jgi:hypothetical protein